MIALFSLALSILSVQPAHAQQFYDIKHPMLQAFEFKLACKTQWHASAKSFTADLSGHLSLSLQNGSVLAVKSSYFTESGYGKTKEEACADAHKTFFADNTIRSWVNSLEALRTRAPILGDSDHSRPRCVLPSLRVFRAPGQSPIEATEMEWIANPVACPQ